MSRNYARRLMALAATLLVSATAQAQLFRAYLDPSGLDSNPCTLASPCRLLPAALTAVASGGEIWMLDSANYNVGPVAITKSVTILAVPGALGSLVALGGNAIDISTAGVTVTLRNLVIVPFPGGGGTNGIVASAADRIVVEGCVIAGLQTGIVTNGNMALRVTDTTIRDNSVMGVQVQNGTRATLTRLTVAGNTVNGIQALGATPGTTTTLDVSDSSIGGSQNGVNATSSDAGALVKASVRSSRVVRNTNAGMLAQNVATQLTASGNLVSNNASGISVNGTGKVFASANTVSDNVTGLQNSASTFRSSGDNAVRNNTSADVTGTVTVIPTL